MIRWEYTSFKLDAKGFLGGLADLPSIERELNARGREGWELVNGFDTNQSYGASRELVFVMKRPLT